MKDGIVSFMKCTNSKHGQFARYHGKYLYSLIRMGINW